MKLRTYFISLGIFIGVIVALGVICGHSISDTSSTEKNVVSSNAKASEPTLSEIIDAELEKQRNSKESVGRYTLMTDKGKSLSFTLKPFDNSTYIDMFLNSVYVNDTYMVINVLDSIDGYNGLTDDYNGITEDVNNYDEKVYIKYLGYDIKYLRYRDKYERCTFFVNLNNGVYLHIYAFVNATDNIETFLKNADFKLNE